MTNSTNDSINLILSKLSDLECRLDRTGVNSPTSPSRADALVEMEIKIRRARDRAFPNGYFADTAWELLLELFTARQTGQRYSISDLGLPAGIPATTTLRYIDKMLQDGFVERLPDPTDRRRVFIRLSDYGASTMNAVFTGVPDPLHRSSTAAEKRLGVDNNENVQMNFKEFPGQSVFV